MNAAMYAFANYGQKVDLTHISQRAGLIGSDKAHEVAMTAAQAAANIFTQSGFFQDSIGKEIAAAYLQAYEAVEGWTKAPVDANPTKDVPAKTVSIYRNGNFFSVTVNGKDEACMNFRIGDYQTATFTLPKDA